MNFRIKTLQKQSYFSRMFSVGIFFCAVMLLCQLTCHASTVSLQWGTSSGATGYKVYYQASSNVTPFAYSIDTKTQTNATITGLDSSQSYYFAVVAYNSSNVESSYSNVVAIHPLSVSLAGTGSGNVNSSPSGVSCLSSTCTSQFIGGSSITLLAAPSNTSTQLSYFSGWNGCTSVSGASCTLTNISAAKNVTATFSANQPVHIANSSSYYSSLQTAYNYAGSTSTIQTQSVNISGNLTTNSSTKALTIAGGYDATYSSRSGYTVLKGTLTVGSGSLVVDNVVISP